MQDKEQVIKIKEQFNKLFEIYKKNLNAEALGAAQFSFSSKSHYQLILITPEEYSTKQELIKLLLSQNKKLKLTFKVTNDIIDEFSKKSLDNQQNIDMIFNEMLKKISQIKPKTFIIFKPVTIHISINEPIKIINLTLIPNPVKYIENFYKNSQHIKIITSRAEYMFKNQDPYSPTMPDIGAMAEISAIDDIEVDNIFLKYGQEVAGFLNLFQPGCAIYFTTQRPMHITSSLISQGDSILAGSGLTDTKLNRVLIDKKQYALYSQYGLEWLNNSRNCLKAKKMAEALYWFSYAVDEINLTNKFIYTITILECILKKDEESIELSTTIAERTAFILGKNEDQRIKIYKYMKNLYNRRSKIIHNGHVLVTNDELMVKEIMNMVRDLLKKLLKEFSSNPQVTFDEFIASFLHKKFNLD